jgi:hypothetical protein
MSHTRSRMSCSVSVSVMSIHQALRGPFSFFISAKARREPRRIVFVAYVAIRTWHSRSVAAARVTVIPRTVLMAFANPACPVATRALRTRRFSRAELRRVSPEKPTPSKCTVCGATRFDWRSRNPVGPLNWSGVETIYGTGLFSVLSAATGSFSSRLWSRRDFAPQLGCCRRLVRPSACSCPGSSPL